MDSCSIGLHVLLLVGLDEIPAVLREGGHVDPTLLVTRRKFAPDEPEPETKPEQVEVEVEIGEVEQAVRHAVMATDGGVSTVEPPESDGDDEPACVCEIDPDGLGCFEHFEGGGDE